MNHRPRTERVLIACVTLVAFACGEDTPEAVDAGACPAIAACGGDIVGSWSVRSLCFDSLDGLFMDLLGTSDCAGTVKDMHVSIAGTFDFDRDGGVLIDVTQKIDLEATFSAECLVPTPDEQVCEELERILSEDVHEATCELEDGGCACAISGPEDRYVGNERYEVRGAMLQQAGSESTYCVEGDELRIRRTAAGVMGTFVLERD